MNELIRLAKEKGFNPCIASISSPELAELFRLYELQKWLEDSYMVFTGVENLNNDTEEFEGNIIFLPFIEIKKENELLRLAGKYFELASGEKIIALKNCLMKALKLIS